ncbi:MAG: rhodanese-like domain-containing protein [Pseudomonadota bacterium]|nr:MAG: rhodanese-like domain-containing protein [Pseudomonadota bacterium]
MRVTLAFSLLLSVLAGAATAQPTQEGFPGRAEFPEVPVIEIGELRQRLGKVVIVDTRSEYEYQTLSIKGAVNIPVAAKDFEARLKALRARSGDPIVFYCNGRSCFKSYQAVKRAVKASVAKTLAFDAGMFEWAQAYPDLAVLLGESPVRQSDIIPGADFRKRLLAPEQFSEEAYNMGRQALILDVRDKYQRAGVGFFPGKERWVSLDQTERLKGYIDQAKREQRTLFIYDEVGKQVRWLQYALKDAGVSNYYFMKKGAKGFYTEVVGAPQ